MSTTSPTAEFVRPTAFAIETLVAKYDGRAPRYTSYPTAVQFTPEVDADTYQRWLAELPRDVAVKIAHGNGERMFAIKLSP